MTADRKPSRPAINTATRTAQAFADASQDIPVPLGVKFDGDMEKELWRTFTAARSRSDWMPHDLVTLTKIVEIEIDIRDVKATLKREGYVVENQRGTMVENANTRVYSTLLGMQLALIRSLSINTTSSAKATVQANAKEDQKALETMKAKGPLSLIASRN
jgi:hypothetical protein